jgi:hypothetical protein
MEISRKNLPFFKQASFSIAPNISMVLTDKVSQGYVVKWEKHRFGNAFENCS